MCFASEKWFKTLCSLSIVFSTEKCVNDRRMIHLRTGGCQGAGTCCCASNLGVVDAMIWGN